MHSPSVLRRSQRDRLPHRAIDEITPRPNARILRLHRNATSHRQAVNKTKPYAKDFSFWVTLVNLLARKDARFKKWWQTQGWNVYQREKGKLWTIMALKFKRDACSWLEIATNLKQERLRLQNSFQKRRKIRVRICSGSSRERPVEESLVRRDRTCNKYDSNFVIKTTYAELHEILLWATLSVRSRRETLTLEGSEYTMVTAFG